MEAELSRLRQENAKLKLEKEILKKAAAYFAQGVDVKYAWIEKQRQTYSMTMMCELLRSRAAAQRGARARAVGARARTMSSWSSKSGMRSSSIEVGTAGGE